MYIYIYVSIHIYIYIWDILELPAFRNRFSEYMGTYVYIDIYIYCTSGYELITWICLKIDNQLPSYPSRLSMCLADFVAEETG